MKTIKILNLYACLGGNRFKWDESAKQGGVKIQVKALRDLPIRLAVIKKLAPEYIFRRFSILITEIK